MYQSGRVVSYLFVISIFLFFGCNRPKIRTMEVTASAYNSVKSQTSSEPNIAAWGDTLKPGMKVIAISRDLLDSGFYHKMEVNIEGLEGTYVVLDLMNRRWTKKIDLYMGTDVEKAEEWGNQKVTISWLSTKKK
jgi:3D (Asp-Asp-Asp) domain-containing protein